jgi:hypothetical protein
VTDLATTAVSVSGGAVGLYLGGSASSSVDTKVVGATVGVRVAGASEQVTLTGLRIRDAQTAVVAAGGTRGVTLSGLEIDQHGGMGIDSGATALVVERSSVSGADVGLNLRGIATVRDTIVTDAEHALRVGPNSQVRLHHGELSATLVGIQVAASGHAIVVDSSVHAPIGAHGRVTLHGRQDFPRLPVHWLGVVALGALLAAVGLELLHGIRNRRQRRLTHVQTSNT